jgi:A/G-specific adenine glycosylase
MMLQQTRVAVVEEYYRRWMERFPTIAALAAADLDAVLKVWEGLGYYARARNLHKAAQIVVAEHGGRLPTDPAALLALPGIGRYSAGAILSLAHNQPQPLLDGNVKRVLARLGDLALPIDQPAADRLLWQAATLLVESAPHDAQGNATHGALNEALMEVGALICTPRKPRCLLCPVQAHCLAYARGTVDVRPVRSPRKQTPHYHVAAGVIWQGAPFRSALLIAQRPADGLLGGLWEFPGGKWEEQDGETEGVPDLRATLRREIAEELALEIAVGAEVAQVAHAFTHFRITLHAFHARHVAGEPQALGVAAFRWIDFVALLDFPMGKADRIVTQTLLHHS